MDSADYFYNMNEQPEGRSWEEWGTEWWKWVLTKPDSTNPVNDIDGGFQGIGQTHPKMFMLAGTHSKKAERTVTVPKGTSIFTCVAVMSASFAEFPKLKTVNELLTYAKQGNNVEDMKVTISKMQDMGKRTDQVTLEKTDLQQYHVTSSNAFQVTLPRHNLQLYAKEGETFVVSDGYWICLRPLHPGNYDLEVSQTTADDPTTLTLNCSYDITYHLNVA